MVRVGRLLLVVTLLAGCLPPWPVGEAEPVWPDEDGDDVAVLDDDDAAPDDDDSTLDDDDDDIIDDDDSGPVDADGDGFGVDQDCDDGDPEIHPGATDLPCDGVDSDCDGVSSCQPCQQGTVLELGTVTLGTHDLVGSLAAGDQIHGLEEDRYFDVVRFTTGVMGLHNFDLISSEFDAYLILYQDDCVQLAADDNSGGSGNASIHNFWFDAGVSVRALISCVDEREVGAYEFRYDAWGF